MRPDNKDPDFKSPISDGDQFAEFPAALGFSLILSNAELAEAITFAYERCSEPYTGCYTTSNTFTGKLIRDHLERLLKIQCARASLADRSLLDTASR